MYLAFAGPSAFPLIFLVGISPVLAVVVSAVASGILDILVFVVSLVQVSAPFAYVLTFPAPILDVAFFRDVVRAYHLTILSLHV